MARRDAERDAQDDLDDDDRDDDRDGGGEDSDAEDRRAVTLERANTGDEDEDLLAQIESLPRVARVALAMRPTHVDPKPEVKQPKANIGLSLKPFIPKVRSQMVTMSDMGSFGRARNQDRPARAKGKPQ